MTQLSMERSLTFSQTTLKGSESSPDTANIVDVSARSGEIENNVFQAGSDQSVTCSETGSLSHDDPKDQENENPKDRKKLGDDCKEGGLHPRETGKCHGKHCGPRGKGGKDHGKHERKHRKNHKGHEGNEEYCGLRGMHHGGNQDYFVRGMHHMGHHGHFSQRELPHGEFDDFPRARREHYFAKHGKDFGTRGEYHGRHGKDFGTRGEYHGRHGNQHEEIGEFHEGGRRHFGHGWNHHRGLNMHPEEFNEHHGKHRRYHKEHFGKHENYNSERAKVFGGHPENFPEYGRFHEVPGVPHGFPVYHFETKETSFGGHRRGHRGMRGWGHHRHMFKDVPLEPSFPRHYFDEAEGPRGKARAVKIAEHMDHFKGPRDAHIWHSMNAPPHPFHFHGGSPFHRGPPFHGHHQDARFHMELHHGGPFEPPHHRFSHHNW